MSEQHKNPDEKDTDTQVSVSVSLSFNNCLAALFTLSVSSCEEQQNSTIMLLFSFCNYSLPLLRVDANSSKHMYCIFPVDMHQKHLVWPVFSDTDAR